MAEKLPKTYDAAALERIVHNLEKSIDALQRPKLRRIKSVAADAAQNLVVNEPGYVLDDDQNFDLVVRGEDSRLYRISGQASAVGGSSGSGGTTDHGMLSGLSDNDHPQYVLDAGDTMTGALVIDGSADAIQGRFQSHSTQTNPVIQIEDSATVAQIKLQGDGGAIFNENGNGGNADFRVETDTDANALYVDASANTVQVGAATTSDSAKFYVSGKISVSGEAEVNGDFNHDGTNVGFYGVAPTTRPAATDEIKSGLASLGLLTDGGASPLNLDGGKLTCDEVEIDGALNHDGSTVGFHGATPQSQSTGWSVSNVTPDKSFDADATSIDELADVLGTLITHLLARGDLGA